VVNKDKAGLFMLDADTLKRLTVFDVWEDDSPETENLVADDLPNPTWLRRSEENIAAPEIASDAREKRKSAA
jgi:hypothetical protein